MSSSTKLLAAPSPTGSSQRIRVAPEEVTIQYWGLRDDGWPAWLNMPLGLGVCLTLGIIGGQPALATLLGAGMIVTLWPVWAPRTFRLDEQGVVQTVWGRSYRIPWTAVRHFETRPRGVVFFPDETVTLLSLLRGFYVPFGSQQEKVLACVDYYLSTWTSESRD